MHLSLFIIFLCFAFVHPAFIPASFASKSNDVVKFEAVFANQKFDYEMKRPVEDLCASERQVKVVVLISSGPQNFDKRQAIRESWMYDKANPAGYLSLFIIGEVENKVVSDAVHEEELKYKDIIRYTSTDLYNKLPLKTHASLSWTREFCPTADYMLKTDDDTVLHLARFDYFVRTDFDQKVKSDSATIFCNRRQSTPIRKPWSKYFMSYAEYNDTVYPAYCQGCSYLVSREAVSKLLDHTREVSYIHLEDVLFTGIVAAKADVNREGSKVFGFKGYDSVDVNGVPYLSDVVGLPSFAIPRAYEVLKSMNQNQTHAINHDYHTSRLNF